MRLSSPVLAAPAFAADLGSHGDRVALRTETVELSYVELAGRVGDAATWLGPDRQLVAVAGANDIDTIVWYLAALTGGHPVLLGAEPGIDRLIERYDPDAVVRSGSEPLRRHRRPVHDLHPDLALLLSTSGSTGSPKVVRLSHENLDSNAAAIAEYLGLGADDRTVTTLPPHYCYGLSVLNSHLRVGASVALTDLSVVDPCFWVRFREVGATGLAGVPHTFALLDRSGFASMDLPDLRYVTQAGGRLPPETVRRYADLGAQQGWELYVMYGQTEATARMAYLPPNLASTHPGAVGIPIPGGTIDIEPVPDCDLPGHGEIVYSGPNVMLGYAEEAADLALGRVVHELRTGDIGRRSAAGLVEVTGRRSRFAKIFGLRIDLDAIEAHLAEHDITAVCTSDDVRVVVGTEQPVDPDVVAASVRDLVGLPDRAVQVLVSDELPRLPSGKPDHRALIATAAERAAADVPEPAGARSDRVRSHFARVLGIPRTEAIDGRDTFSSLGGDSLSYVELSVALEDDLGQLPAGWHLLPVDALAAMTPHRPGRWRRVDTSVVLRAVSIVLIVGNHAGLFLVPGGAHVLLAVAGFNLARFQLGTTSLWPGILRIAVPSVAWIGLVAAASDEWGLRHALLVNSFLGAPDSRWSYWFIETVLVLLVGTACLFAIPVVRRIDAARPFGLAIVVALAGLLVRFDLIDLPAQSRQTYRPQEVLWLFALGWAAARSTTATRRMIVCALALPAIAGFFGDPGREAVLAIGVLAIVWLPTVAVPAFLVKVVAALAGASLHVYLVHWQVYPHLVGLSRPLAVVSALAAGVLAQRFAGGVTATGHRWISGWRSTVEPAARSGRREVGARLIPS